MMFQFNFRIEIKSITDNNIDCENVRVTKFYWGKFEK